MNATYNIYRQTIGNSVAWVDRVQGLRQAEERVALAGVGDDRFHLDFIPKEVHLLVEKPDTELLDILARRPERARNGKEHEDQSSLHQLL